MCAACGRSAYAHSASRGCTTAASLLPTQIYYHLEEYGEAVRLALGSGRYFDIEGDRTQYTDTMLGACGRVRAGVGRAA